MRGDRPEPKPLAASIPLYRRGRPEAVVVVPDDNHDAELAGGTCSEYLAHVFGRELPVVREGEYGLARRLREKHIIVTGGLGVSRLATELYLLGYHYCDARFPGPDGYVVRTISDPYGDGRNVILLAGGDASGWYAGTEALCDLFAYVDERATVPPTNCVRSRLAPNPAGPEATELGRAQLLEIAESRPRGAAMRLLLDWAAAYDLGGDVGWGLAFRHGFAALTRSAVRRSVPDDAWAGDAAEWLAVFIRLWDNIEERCVFDQESRSSIGAFLLAAARRLYDNWRSHCMGLPPHEFPDAAWVGTLSGLDAAGRYFSRRYELAEARAWSEAFRAALEQDRVLAPLAGSSAWDQCRALHDLLGLALLHPEWQGAMQAVRVAARWASVFWPAGSCAVAFGPRALHMQDFVRLCGRAAWLAGQAAASVPGECLAATADQYAPGALYLSRAPAVVRPETGVAAILLAESARGPHAGTRLGAEPRDPRAELLHTGTTLRWFGSPAREFMLLGGTRVAPDAHEDVQAVLRLDYYSRPFIADLPEGGPTTEQHAGLVLDVDGQRVVPSLAALTGVLNAGRVRIAVSTTLDADVPEWRRAVFHVPGRGFLVLDAVRPRFRSRVSASAIFPLIGDLEHDAPRRVTVRQGGTALDLRPVGAIEPAVTSLPQELAPLRMLVEEAGDLIHRAQWAVEEQLTPDQELRLATEVVLRPAASVPRLVTHGSPRGPLRCELPNGRAVYLGTEWDPIGGTEIVAEAAAFVLGALMGFAGLLRLEMADDYIEATAPCGVLLDVEAQQAQIVALVETEVFVGHRGDTLSATLDPNAVLDVAIDVPREPLAEVVARAEEITVGRLGNP